MSRYPIALALLLCSAGAVAAGANPTIWGPSAKPIEVSEALRMHADFSPEVDQVTQGANNSEELDCPTWCDETCGDEGWVVCVSGHDYCEVTCYGSDDEEDEFIGQSARVQAF